VINKNKTFEQDIQHLKNLESEIKKINLSIPLHLEPKFDETLEEQECDSTIFSQ
jgi:short-subunit dehydrogenase involved in D-alanine esterification of teichoic acids